MLKRVLTGLAIGAAVICAIVFVPVQAIWPAVAALCVLAFAEYTVLWRKKLAPSGLSPLSAAMLLFGYAAIGCGLMSLPWIAAEHGNLMMLYTVAVVKFSDVGGFAFGLSSAKLMKGGNHKMCPSISPGKSWEGLAGSLLFSSGVSIAFMGITHFSLSKSIALGVVAALVGTAGDLVESRFKRWVGVKDSSALTVTNGLGGLLDMFDSLIFAPAVMSCFY